MNSSRWTWKTTVSRKAFSTMMTSGAAIFGPGPHVAAHRRRGVADKQGKKFVARTNAPDPPLMHENDLVDQRKKIGPVIDDQFWPCLLSP
jgi:hypothetical protein